MDDLVQGFLRPLLIGFVLGTAIYPIAGYVDNIVAAIRRCRTRRTE